MQKINQTTFQLLCLLLLLFSCKRDDGIAAPSEGKELKMTLAKPGSTAALNAATPVEGQEFGVYFLPTGATDLTDALESNRKFRYESGILVPAGGVDPIFYPQDGSGVDVILYSPYQQVSNDGLELNISNQDNQPNLDLVYSKLINSDKNNPIGPISLQHKNSKLKFKLLAGIGLSEGDLAEVGIILSGFYDTGLFDLAAGDFTSGQAGEPISLGEKREATIIPGAYNGSGKFLFHVNGIVLSYTLPIDEVFEGGKQYEYQVTVNRNLVEVKRVSTMEWQVNDNEIFAMSKESEFVYIPAGTFTMGSDYVDPNEIPGSSFPAYPVHQVTISKGFLMSKYEITVGQYVKFLNEKNAQINDDNIYGPGDRSQIWVNNIDGQFKKNTGNPLGPQWENVWNENYPVRNVSWSGARAYAQWAKGDLPTEAQWEYAARAGSKADYFFLDDNETLAGHESELAEYAWYGGNTGQLNLVGQLKPNPWGLYDIYGNAEEICLDNPRDYTTDPVVDPNVPFSIGVSRGGRNGDPKERVSSTFRGKRSSAGQLLGFRIVKDPSK